MNQLGDAIPGGDSNILYTGNTSGVLPAGTPPMATNAPGSVGPGSAIQPFYPAIGSQDFNPNDFVPESNQTLLLVAIGLIAALWFAGSR